MPYQNNVVVDSINDVGLDETYGTYVGDECLTLMTMMVILVMTLMMIYTDDDTDGDTETDDANVKSC